MRRGDVVLCRLESGRLVLHRIIRLESSPAGPRLLIQGDALLAPDGTISPGAVLGRVAAAYHAGRRFGLEDGLGRLLGMAWLVLLPLRGPCFKLLHIFRV